MAHSLFVWLKRCCRKLPLTDHFRVGSGAGLEPAWRTLPVISYETSEDAGEEFDSDITITSSIFAAPALHTANADRRTEHLASMGESSTGHLRPIQLANIQPYKTEGIVVLDNGIGILIR